MNTHWLKKVFFSWYTLGCIVVVFAVLNVFFVLRDVQTYRSQNPDRQAFMSMHRERPVTPNAIAPWMTFVYVEKVFKLPTGYLSTVLGLTDPRYPRITIEHYAKDAGVDRAVFLQKVIAAVGDYTAATTTLLHQP